MWCVCFSWSLPPNEHCQDNFDEQSSRNCFLGVSVSFLVVNFALGGGMVY